MPLDPPKHCCPFWDCEYLDVSNDAETAFFNCGAGDMPIFFQKRLKRVLNDDDHKRWEYRSEEEIDDGTGVTFEVTVDCDRTAARLETGAGPCGTLSAYYNDGLGTEWQFGPITINRQCSCLDDEIPAYGHVGFTWGTGTVTADQIAADPNNPDTLPCTFGLGAGDVITIYCNCANCPCWGSPTSLEVRFECALWPGGPIDVVIPMTYVDATTLPAPNDNYRPIPSKVWFGSYDLGSGCSLECVVDCDFAVFNSGPRLLGLYLVVGGGCTLDPADISSRCGLVGPGFAGNAILLSSTCHDESTNFEAVYGYCSSVLDPVCDGIFPSTGTILSTVTIREV